MSLTRSNHPASRILVQKLSLLIKSFLPRVPAALFILLFLGVLTIGPRMLNIDGDLPRHLLMGKVVLETGAAPTQEIFSYPYEGRTYAPHEWLAGVIYYLTYLLLGLDGVVLLAAVLIASTFTVIYAEVTSQNNHAFLNFLIIFLGASITSVHWITRPHLFTMLFLATWIILLDRLRRGMLVKLWIFPVLMLLWANIHAEFIAGFLVLLAYLAGWFWQSFITRSNAVNETGRRLFPVTILSLAASLFNPSGMQTWNVVFSYVNNRYLLSHIVETRPPNFAQPEYWPLLIMMALGILAKILKRDKLPPAHTFLLIGFGIMSLLAARNVHLVGVVFSFILSMTLGGSILFRPFEIIEATVKQIESHVTGTMIPILLTVLLCAVILTRPADQINRFEPTVFPVDAVHWLESHPQNGRMFNAFDWGGYILFHLWPEQKVFIESQGDLTGELTRQYETVISLREGWQEIFTQYNIAWAIIPSESPLAKELEIEGWESAYQDQTAVILVRK